METGNWQGGFKGVRPHPNPFPEGEGTFWTYYRRREMGVHKFTPHPNPPSGGEGIQYEEMMR